MADQKSGPSFEATREAISGGEQRTEVEVGRAADAEKIPSARESLIEEEKTSQILRKLNEGAQEILAAEMEEKEVSLEERKEKVITAWVMKALAAGDDYTKAEQIINEARKKYLVKYPGVVDAIHDRWMDQRSDGM